MKVNFRDKLEHQFLYMEDSAVGYDRGARHEAIRLSTSLRVICHTTKKSTSLLTHLDAEGISFLSTSQQHVELLGEEPAITEAHPPAHAAVKQETEGDRAAKRRARDERG